MGCDEYPKVESGMLVLKRKPKGDGTREAEGDIVYLNWCTKESTRGTVPELIMRDISTWCASREWNPVLNDGNTNIVNKNIKCSSNEGNNGSSSNSFNRDINGISNVRKNGSRIRVNTPCQKYDPVVCSKAPWLSMSQVGEQVIASMSGQVIAAILAAK